MLMLFWLRSQALSLFMFYIGFLPLGLQATNLKTLSLRPVGEIILQKDSENVPLKILMKGNPTIVFYGATWCPSCHRNIEGFDAFVSQWKGEKLSFVVARGPDLRGQEADSLTKGYLNLITYVDGSIQLREAGEIDVYPSYLFVDAKGRVQAKHRGSIDWQDPSVQNMIADFVAKKGELQSPSFWTKALNWIQGLIS